MISLCFEYFNGKCFFLMYVCTDVHDIYVCVRVHACVGSVWEGDN